MAADPVASLRTLSERMGRNEIDTLLILGDANPAYDAPIDFDFATKLAAVPNAIHCGLWRDETAQRCSWHVNRAHDFESWADGRAFDGTVSVVQPLIAPLYDGLSDIELIARLFALDDKEGYKLVRYYWEGQRRDRRLRRLVGGDAARRPGQGHRAAGGRDADRRPSRARQGDGASRGCERE